MNTSIVKPGMSPSPVDPAGAVRYEILGPLRISGASEGPLIRAHKIQVMLAVLLIRSGQIVPIEYLTEEIWGESAPRRATAAVHVYISQLRKSLSQHGAPDDAIVTRPPGYLLNVGDAGLDVYEFEQRVRQGRDHAWAGAHTEAVESYEAALALWRGPALSGLRDSPVINAFAAWLDECRLEAAEMMIESSLALGRHRAITSFLYSLINQHALHEAFYRQLMLALYRSDRQADALRVYQSARTILKEELGLEPCRALRDLHRQILSGADLSNVVPTSGAA
ncbi:AfsR/SARP family transcriptional regulator [Actinoplanes sp. N902-109]|uniref:AfsR/SARP family transcriptional regulator n=1 Tax=Actinoplanes sp. (strain N902-109) TaxID=649831 RepID=UPI00032936A2|nr:AfsR/SARP family transcriptional regulator [Actinoplanes sp. N902-109]AGL15948.1 putative pathway specific activator [Actinoplanes sp. N902-109]